MKMNETQQKIDGAYMTPSSIVKKMIEFTANGLML